MHEENDGKTYSSYQEYLDDKIKDGGALAYAQLLIESHVTHVTPDPFGVSAEDVLWAVGYLLDAEGKPCSSGHADFYEVVCDGDAAVRAEWFDRALRFEMEGDSTSRIGYAILRSQGGECALDAFVENMQGEGREFRFVDGLKVLLGRDDE